MTTDADFTGRRAELMAELFLGDMQPKFVAKAPQDFGFDFIVGFNNKRGGVNIVAVEVKMGMSSQSSVQMSRRQQTLLANSNVPGMVLVVDVKRNKVLYGLIEANEENSSSVRVRQPIVLAEENTCTYLRRLFESDRYPPAA